MPYELSLEGIHDLDAAQVKVTDVSGGKREMVSAGDGSNLTVREAHGPTQLSTAAHEITEQVGRCRVEWENPLIKPPANEALKTVGKCAATPSAGQDTNAEANLGNRDGRQVEIFSFLVVEPPENPIRRRRFHDLGDDVGIEEDHELRSTGS